MKGLIIAIIIGAVGYYVFFYEPNPEPVAQEQQTQQQEQAAENEKILEEAGIENKTYQGAFAETYDSIKNTVQSAKDSVKKIEDRSQEEY